MHSSRTHQTHTNAFITHTSNTHKCIHHPHIKHTQMHSSRTHQTHISYHTTKHMDVSDRQFFNYSDKVHKERFCYGKSLNRNMRHCHCHFTDLFWLQLSVVLFHRFIFSQSRLLRFHDKSLKSKTYENNDILGQVYKR